ncbi:MAG: hypothetical protein ABIV10_00210 [Gemmatimonadaceae bacterium]
MDSTLFSNRSMLTMTDGIVLVAGRAIPRPVRETPYRPRRNAPSTISRTPGG